MSDLFEEYAENELLVLNIQFLGLVQGAWEFSRGARTQRIYTCPTDGNLHIKDFYSYTMDPENREVTSIVRKIQWFRPDGSVGLEKDISPTLNIKNRKELNRSIRQGRIDYLEAAGDQLAAASPHVPEPFKTDFLKASQSLEIIFKYYSKEVDSYIQRGTLDFEKAVEEEQNPTILDIFALQTYIPDEDFPNGLTVKDAILWQLKGVKP